MSLKVLVDNVINWAYDRNLIAGSTPDKQFLKTVEELGELSSALGKKDRWEIKDGIGDVVVTLIIMAEQLGIEFEDCLALAWDEIKDRKGKMIDGLFVKEA